MSRKPRLPSLPPRIGGLPSRIGQPDATEAERARRRDRTEPWRKLYRSARWARLRMVVLTRDGFQCRRCGFVETDTSRLICDHIVDHKGDEAKFWVGPDGLQTLCIACHGAKARTQQRVARLRRPGGGG